MKKINVLTIIILIGFLFISFNTIRHFSEAHQKYEYYEVMFSRLGSNKCHSYILEYEIEVQFGEIEKGIAGRWIPSRKIVFLDDIGIDTVAHESYHVAQTVIRKYGLEYDEEFGAYIAGSITNCIIGIVVDTNYEMER